MEKSTRTKRIMKALIIRDAKMEQAEADYEAAYQILTSTEFVDEKMLNELNRKSRETNAKIEDEFARAVSAALKR